jgi:tetratricopeptide (TPR) repeat protein
VSGVRTVAIGVIAAVTSILAATGILVARETTLPLPVSEERLLYLTSGDAARRLFLTFDALASDVYWIRTIQHYGRERRSTRTDSRFELLQPLLEVTTTLDPHFNIAYRFGAIFLALDPPNGPKRPDLAIRLLEKGLASNPHRWQYAHDIGFIHYWYTGRFDEAGRWFMRAAAMPGAPEWIEPLAAVTLAQGGDREGARRLLSDLRTAEERYIRQAAQRSLAQLQALDDIDALQGVVEKFRALTGRYPDGWPDLRAAGLLSGTHVDPTGAPYLYFPDRHLVTLAPDSALSPLPLTFKR